MTRSRSPSSHESLTSRRVIGRSGSPTTSPGRRSRRCGATSCCTGPAAALPAAGRSTGSRRSGRGNCRSSAGFSSRIPETGSPLDPTACDASFERAREVYPSHHTAQCTSWLLDPQLAETLPRASNIVRFQHRFELRDEGREANDDVLRFVFHTYEPDLDRLIPQTTLERALVERMREGE